MPYKDPEKRRAYGKAYRNTPEHSEQNKAYQKQYRADNPDSIRETKRRNAIKNAAHISAYQKTWRENHKAHRKAYAHQKYLADRAYRLAWQKAYALAHPEEARSRNVRYHESHRDWYLAYLRDYGPRHQAEMKFAVLTYYGDGEMSCVLCNFTDDRALSIDHIHGGGNKHRKENNITHFYEWLVKKGLPEDYRTLCLNCQHLATLALRNKPSNPDSYYQRLKRDVFQHYCSGDIVCARCGHTDFRVLTLDHTKSDGNEHRKLAGIASGEGTYRWLKKHDYPTGYQVLCYNCQAIKREEQYEFLTPEERNQKFGNGGLSNGK